MKARLTLAKTHDRCRAKQPQLTVVMIHGIAADSTDYHKVLEYLEGDDKLKAVRFVTFDLLGAGKSLKDDELNYDYEEQLLALDNSIRELGATTPLVLVGHSLGTFIVTRYASLHEDLVDELILVSPPVYTTKDLSSPAFMTGIKAFRDVVGLKNRKILDDKSFNNSIDNIVLDRDNYQVLTGLKIPAVLIYGKNDRFIAMHNFAKVLADNANLTAIETDGRHGVTKDKYIEIGKILEGKVDA